MRVLFCGGGTSGHVAPALAIGEAVLADGRGNAIAFVGRQGGAENKPIRQGGYPLYEIRATGIPRTPGAEQLRALRLAVSAEKEAEKILRDFAPDVVVGTGGYVSFPVLHAAMRQKIPAVLHESNAAPGLTVRLLAPRCRYVMTNLAECASYLRKKSNVANVGMPVREAFTLAAHKRDALRKSLGLRSNDFFLLSFGGSIGAEMLNGRCLALMKKMQKTPGAFHLHACGNRYWEAVQKEYPGFCRENGRCRAVPFIDDMPKFMAAADLVICRSGAGTISELAATGTPAVLVPSPNVTGNHQFHNAEEAANRGGAILLEESALTDDVLWQTVSEFRQDKAKQTAMRNAIHALSKPRAKEEILLLLKKAAKST